MILQFQWIIPHVVDGIRKILKSSAKKMEELRIRGRVETIQTTLLLKSGKMLRRASES